MTTFKEFDYARPDLAAFESAFKEQFVALRSAASAEAFGAAMKRVNALREDFESMANIAQIRHTMNTLDAFYEAENDFFDEAGPVMQGHVTEYYRLLVGCPFRDRLEKEWGSQVFRLAELQLKTFSPEVMEDLQAENRLGSEYVKLKAAARIMFEGQERNLAQMVPFAESRDRDTRRRAKEAVAAFYAEHDGDFGRIYHELVALRARIAGKLGFDSFIPLAYARLGRSDYDAAMVASYRAQVREAVVPVARELRARQAKRLGLPALKHYDEDIAFLSGNAAPKGDPAWILAAGKRMYEEMSPETAEFFGFMTSRELMDLETRPGKAAGGYCSYIPNEGAPFIYSNFNGTSGDVDVLTHEAGHAFQGYRSRHFELPEYHWPTLEACEIHSMSMEFFAWPWMESFFKEDAPKYRFNHLAEALMFIPYGAAVDEFQHWVYANPDASPDGRKAAWRRIEREYLPWRDYDGNAFLEDGGFWYRQGHIFEDPFYYIDYTLAQVCAFEFWGKSRADRAGAWKDYLKLCGLGGSLPFTGLLLEAGLGNPFRPGTIARTMEPIKAWLDGVDDMSL